ncbi:DnaD domain protein [Streptococcus gallolyticus subsp. gallolyticus]|uniref:DnaD domain protein n=1 Tax=Streptococcus gallolyticus TaxID=315405 RepID=UPI002001977F|nr:DnaD domain protein [Streptococcus gallolyticus]MCY7155904.1 DnaD domain protein [Streptococcus gallolyticus subsp. gallolyticus]MCY7173306.1 DnaD domain protein [Streptococcus gallolyticus subsp. gallolyticus]MCY7175428.1 DnaD domain protein [Streptococcus gallolyticus subsp. gallolyticus]MCY7179883.1 DnaD domain protein [Streptococcus gallolyticus subsp. gallolyticus]MCY7197434.1 DnaD domain protein [Streptococcus gallolyticus subsp. gallolyticus]
MRPIDEFSYIKNNKVLLDSDSLSQLYHPVIGNHAVLLYDYLLAFFDDGVKRHKFSEILNHLQLSIRQVEEAFAILTAVDLLVLYQTRDAYVLKLQPALNRETFLSNPVYRRLLEQEIGDVAVAELDIKIPQEARDISKKFSDIFSAEGTPKPKANVSKNHFDLDSFERLMLRDGLQFKDEKADVVSIYSLADKYTMNWFDTYHLAKSTAINGKISPQRMTVQLEQPKNVKSQGQSKEQFDTKEQVIIREAKQANAREFLEKIKAPRRAVVTESERKLLEELANMSFLDEVINVMVLYTLNKTQSANLNKPYIMKVANDFAYQNITTAEAAVLKMRSFAQRNKDRKVQAKVAKSNVPEWTAKEYKHVATAEEKAKLEELKRSMLED